jgi:predicted secreted protein
MRRPAIVLALALSACASAPPEPARRAIVHPAFVTLAEQDALIELEPGARLHVLLESEKASRRRWHVTAVRGDAVAVHGSPWFTSKNVYQMSIGGNWIFDFDAAAPGRASVAFDYRRDDEPLSAAERTASFDVVVR